MPFFETGTFASGEIERNQAGGLETSFHSSMTGSTAEISLTNIMLTPIGTPGCVGLRGACTFDSGTVTVRDPITLMALFTGSLVDGHVTKTSLGADITADVLPVSKIFPTGSVVNYLATFPEASGSALTGERAFVSAIPEPGTLCLLGTSVIGFAGIARRRLKLGRYTRI
jgi:hypothetical protein